MRIALTTFYTQSYLPLAEITRPVMEAYCKLHGYHLNVRVIGNDESFHFVKTKDARELLESFDVVMAIEIDCLITNPHYTVTQFLDNEHEFYYTTDRNGPNTGVFIAKSTQYVKDLLDEINRNEKNYGDEQNFFENFHPPKCKIVEHPCFNSIPYWPHYKPSFGKIGYKEGEINDELPLSIPGHWFNSHFVMHLPGVSLDRRVDIFQNHLNDIVL